MSDALLHNCNYLMKGLTVSVFTSQVYHLRQRLVQKTPVKDDRRFYCVDE